MLFRRGGLLGLGLGGFFALFVEESTHRRDAEKKHRTERLQIDPQPDMYMNACGEDVYPYIERV
jgi:hypothetical protein